MAGEAAAVAAAAWLSCRSTKLFSGCTVGPRVRLRQAVSDLQELFLSDRPGHAIDAALLDPDDRSAQACVVTQRGALDTLDPDCAGLHIAGGDGERQGALGVVDALD